MIDKSDIKHIYLVATRKILYMYDWIKDNQGLFSIALFLVITISSSYITGLIIATVFYLLVLKKEMNDHKKNDDNMNLIDVDYFNFAHAPGLDPLDAYIDSYFNMYVLLFRGFKQGIYIRQEEEKIILKELMDMVAKNMGKPFKTKLELYYGIGHIEDLLAQKCYIRVAMYVADANKNIYADDNGEKDKLTKEVMKQMMMNK